MATPSPGEGILDVCDRLSRLSTGPFPPVSALHLILQSRHISNYTSNPLRVLVIQVAPKAAAVLVPLFEDESGIVRVLLTQRSPNLSTHRGRQQC